MVLLFLYQVLLTFFHDDIISVMDEDTASDSSTE